MKRLWLFLLSSLVFACTPGKSGPGEVGPEEVLRDYHNAISNAECDLARSMVSKNAGRDVFFFIDGGGCFKFPLEVFNITCEEQGEYASCACTRSYPPDPTVDITTHWFMVKDEKTWKVDQLYKESEFSKHQDR